MAKRVALKNLPLDDLVRKVREEAETLLGLIGDMLNYMDTWQPGKGEDAKASFNWALHNEDFAEMLWQSVANNELVLAVAEWPEDYRPDLLTTHRGIKTQQRALEQLLVLYDRLPGHDQLVKEGLVPWSSHRPRRKRKEG
jgi:hypothetical protein